MGAFGFILSNPQIQIKPDEIFYSTSDKRLSHQSLCSQKLASLPTWETRLDVCFTSAFFFFKLKSSGYFLFIHVMRCRVEERAQSWLDLD